MASSCEAGAHLRYERRRHRRPRSRPDRRGAAAAPASAPGAQREADPFAGPRFEQPGRVTGDDDATEAQRRRVRRGSGSGARSRASGSMPVRPSRCTNPRRYARVALAVAPGRDHADGQRVALREHPCVRPGDRPPVEEQPVPPAAGDVRRRPAAPPRGRGRPGRTRRRRAAPVTPDEPSAPITVATLRRSSRRPGVPPHGRRAGRCRGPVARSRTTAPAATAAARSASSNSARRTSRSSGSEPRRAGCSRGGRCA